MIIDSFNKIKFVYVRFGFENLAFTTGIRFQRHNNLETISFAISTRMNKQSRILTSIYFWYTYIIPLQTILIILLPVFEKPQNYNLNQSELYIVLSLI